jgi:F420-dependent oxidoreductase-like protein
VSEIRFGFVIPQGWSYDLIAPSLTLSQRQKQEQDPIEEYKFSKTIAEIADKHSKFDSIYTYDHFLPYYASSDQKDFFECFTLLSAIAAITKKLKIGQVVTCSSYRKPSLLAKMLSTLDIISNGRLELGIGAGWNKREYIQYGYDFPSDITRIKQLEEAINIIKAMWTQKEATFFGKYYSIKNAICNPKPLQKPHPTIMIGGSGEKYLLKVAAKYADRYNHPGGGDAKVLKRKISILKEYCANYKRDSSEIEYSILISCLIKSTDDEVQQIVKQRKKQPYGMQQITEAAHNSTIGTPENIVTGLNKYVDVGVRHFIMDFIGLDKTTITLFNSKVIQRV